MYAAGLLAARVPDAANASYGLMLRLLASGFSMASGKSETRRVEMESAMRSDATSTVSILLRAKWNWFGVAHIKIIPFTFVNQHESVAYIKAV